MILMLCHIKLACLSLTKNIILIKSLTVRVRVLKSAIMAIVGLDSNHQGPMFETVSYSMLRMTHPSVSFFVLSLFCVNACLYG